MRSLEAEHSVWTGECFVDPASAALEGDQTLAPALYTVETALAAKFRALLFLFKVYHSLSILIIQTNSSAQNLYNETFMSSPYLVD